MHNKLINVAPRAEVFDNFLDHAHSYLDRDMKNEAGVIGGVVFEDTITSNRAVSRARGTRRSTRPCYLSS